jgi:hypothetical protein
VFRTWKVRLLFPPFLAFPNRPNDSFLSLGNLSNDGRKINRLVRELLEFRNPRTIKDPETVSFEERKSAAVIEGNHLGTDLSDPLLGQESQKRLQNCPEGGDALDLR